MSESITDANDCIVKVGSTQAGGTKGRLILTDFQLDESQNKTRKYGIGNKHAQGRTHGNIEVDLSFTHEGENADLFETIQEGNFTVALTGNEWRWRLQDVDHTDFSVQVDDEEYTFDFDGNALSYDGERL